MLTIVMTLVGAYMFALMARVMDERNNKFGKIYFLIVTAVIIIAVAGFRTNIGDTFVYVSGYKKLLGKTLEEVIAGVGDVGYYIYEYYLYQISSNPQFMIFINALLTQGLYLIFFRKYKSYFELEVFMYITSGIYFVTMNGLRQSLAAGFVSMSTKYIIKGEFKKFLPLILFTSTLHQSALIMIPIYFIARMKPWSKKIFIMIGLAVVGTILFYELLPILAEILKGTNYEHYIQIFLEGTEEGANVLRVGVALVPLILSYIKKEEISKVEWGNVFINMCVLNFIFMFFSLQTWIFARFTIYFGLYTFVLLPYTIKIWENKKEKRLIYVFFMICYFIFFMTEQRLAERIQFYKF